MYRQLNDRPKLGACIQLRYNSIWVDPATIKEGGKMTRIITPTLTKHELMALGYGPSFSKDIIRQAKLLLVKSGHPYYKSKRLGRVPISTVEEMLGIVLRGAIYRPNIKQKRRIISTTTIWSAEIIRRYFNAH